MAFGHSSGSLVVNNLWESIQFTNTLDMNVDQATIAFPDATIAKSFVGQVCRIYRDGVAKWSGLAASVDFKFRYDRQSYDWTLTCISNKVYFQREIFQKDSNFIVQYGGVTYNSNTSGATPPAPYSSLVIGILGDIMQCQNTPVLTLGANSTSNEPHINILAQTFDCLKFLTQVLQGTRWEVRFNPDDTVDLLPEVGNAANNFLFQEGMNILTSDYSFDISAMINYVVALGAGNGKAAGTSGIVSTQIQKVAFNQSSINTYGRWSKVVSFPNVTDGNLLQLYADALLADLDQPVQTLTLEVVDITPGASYYVADTVIVNNPKIGLSNQQFRIVKEQRQYDYNNGEQITLTLAQNFHMFTITHFRVQTLENLLNNFGNYAQTTTNTFTENPVALPPSTS